MNKSINENYYYILKQEMIKALGCTEPIAVALAGAKTREILGNFPDKVTIKCSPNIVKNVKGVTVPTTGNMIGIDVACMLGAIAGDSSLNLEVLAKVEEADIEKLKEVLKSDICKVENIDSEDNLNIICIMEKGNETAEVQIIHSHSNIALIKKNGKIIFENVENADSNENIDTSILNFDDILNFAENFDINELKDLFELELTCNNAIAEEGLKNNYGANVGKTILENAKANDLKSKIKAYAAAGSDARMSGCNMPVVINSGSGNQGMVIASTIYRYWESLNISREKLYRALCLGNLLALWQKSKIGKLSAFCGASSAASAAGAAITYMAGGTKKQIGDTLTNTLASIGGMVCDGAKPSCALKIAAAVDAALTSHDMSMSGNTFKSGEGLVKDDVEKTVESICCMAREGMADTDKKIIEIMLS